MDLNTVADALAAGVEAADIRVNGAHLTATSEAPDALVVPHLFAAEIIGQYHKTHGGQMQLTWTWRLMGSRADDRAGQRALRTIANSTGTGSLLATLEALRGAPGQPALSGACDDLVVQRVSGPRLFEIGTVPYYGLEFTLFVMG